VGAQDEKTGTGPKETLFFEAGDIRRILAKQKEDERQNRIKRESDKRLPRREDNGVLQAPPEEKGGGALDNAEEDGETGEKKAVELLARAARGKCLGFGGKKAGGVFFTGDLVELELFEAFLFLETHLEKADE